MALDVKFQGFPYPVVKTPLGFFQVQNGVEKIKADLLALLLTNPGERVMTLNYGTGLRNLLFEQGDNILIEQAKQMIINAITTFEPRVVITDIVLSVNASDFNNELSPLDTGENEGSILFIKISFRDPNNIQSIESLVLELPTNV